MAPAAEAQRYLPLGHGCSRTVAGAAYRSAVILRIVRSRVRRSHETHVLDVMRQLTASMGAIPGLRWAEFGRAMVGEDMWFVVITRWDGVDAIRSVYGESWATTSILPGAEEYIVETIVEHFETTLDDLTAIVQDRGHETPR